MVDIFAIDLKFRLSFGNADLKNVASRLTIAEFTFHPERDPPKALERIARQHQSDLLLIRIQVFWSPGSDLYMEDAKRQLSGPTLLAVFG
jgi:hypothetical protein